MNAVIILLAIFAASILLAYLSIRRSARETGPMTAAPIEALGQPAPEVIAANKDPRYAAAILLYQTAAFKGDISDEMDAAILSGMEALFHAEKDAAEDLFSDAWRALGEENDTRVPLETLVQPMRDQCTDGERREFLALFQRISTFEGAPNQRQTQLFESLRLLLT